MADASAPEAALVTGGARRIGAAIVRRLAGAGYAVAIHCHMSRDEAERLAADIRETGGRACVVCGDLEDPSAVPGIIGEAARRLGPLTLLVNNASLFERDAASTLTAESFDRHVAINLRAPLLLTKSFAAQAPDGRDASIVNITDQRVEKPTPDFLTYSISKSALHAATTMLAQALAPRVRVNAVAPGPTIANVRQRPEDFARQAAAVPLGHAGTAEEVADALLWLAAARSVTGQTIFVDGGQRLAWRTPDVVNVRE